MLKSPPSKCSARLNRKAYHTASPGPVGGPDKIEIEEVTVMRTTTIAGEQEMDRETLLSSELDDLYAFIAKSYKANSVFRFDGTPFMEAAPRESIAGHMWSTLLHWFNLKSICPALVQVVNSERVYEILLMHDLPEIGQGDVSMFQQLAGNGSGKKAIEREALCSLGQTLPNETRDTWLHYFDLFEAEDITRVTDTAILVARMIDTIQGSFYALTYGDNPVVYAATHNKIINQHLGGTIRQLIAVLEGSGHGDAAGEVRTIMQHYITLWQQQGVKLELDPF